MTTTTTGPGLGTHSARTPLAVAVGSALLTPSAYPADAPWRRSQRPDDVLTWGITDSQAVERAESNFRNLSVLAERIGLTVRWGLDWSDASAFGYYYDDLKLIEIDFRLSPWQRVTTLAHEIGHAVRRDGASSPPAEHAANAIGAALVITESAWKRAQLEVGVPPTTFGAHARSIGCTARLVKAHAGIEVH